MPELRETTIERRTPWWTRLVDRAASRALDALLRWRLISWRTYIRLETRLAEWSFQQERWLVDGQWRRPEPVRGYLWRLE